MYRSTRKKKRIRFFCGVNLWNVSLARHSKSMRTLSGRSKQFFIYYFLDISFAPTHHNPALSPLILPWSSSLSCLFCCFSSSSFCFIFVLCSVLWESKANDREGERKKTRKRDEKRELDQTTKWMREKKRREEKKIRIDNYNSIMTIKLLLFAVGTQRARTQTQKCSQLYTRPTILTTSPSKSSNNT